VIYAVFAAATVVVFVVGPRLARVVETLADRLGIGQVLVGARCRTVFRLVPGGVPPRDAVVDRGRPRCTRPFLAGGGRPGRGRAEDDDDQGARDGLRGKMGELEERPGERVRELESTPTSALWVRFGGFACRCTGGRGVTARSDADAFRASINGYALRHG
jgi:hypothetical protein